jgi:hypothetical protein
MEIINTGDLKRIKYENTEDVAATRIFQGIYGVGKDPLLSLLVDDTQHTLRSSYCLCLVCEWAQNAG